MNDSTENEDPPTSRRFCTVPGLVPVLLSIGLLVALVLVIAPAFNQPSARSRTTALYNLKNIGLATHNYASPNDGNLPPHALAGPDGTAHFGWTVSLLPYLEGQTIYDGLDFDKSWNDPVNREPASVRLKIFLNPRVDGPTEEDGYSLLHYAANSQVFRPDKTWTLDEISARDGLKNTIFFGEIGNRFRPWAAPVSLRDPAEGFGDGPRQFGIPGSNLIVVAFGDGSAKPISRDIDPKILKAWATPDGGEVIPE